MSGITSSCGLVLNINTPDFFGGGQKIKNSGSDKPFATISKRPKTASATVFRQSKSSKLNFPIATNALSRNQTTDNSNHVKKNIKNVPKGKLQKKGQKSASTGNVDRNIKSKLGLSLDNNGGKNGKKIVSAGVDFPLRDAPPGAASAKVKKKAKTSRSGPVISSLFTKNPDIHAHKLPQVNQKTGKEKAKPFVAKTFKTLGIMPQIVSNVEKMGLTLMMPVQQEGIPPALEGSDMLIRSHTGSGKTLVYCLTIIQKLMVKVPKVKRGDGIYAIIIVPTRELAVQSYQWFEKLCKSCIWVVPGYLIGGERRKAEKNRLRKGVNILIATPGRLSDHIETTAAMELSKVEFLVIDEADRMTEMGYEKRLMNIVKSLNDKVDNSSRQTFMLSATLTNAVQKLAGLSLRDPTMIKIGKDDEIDGNPIMPETLSQYYMVVPPKLRLVTLSSFILEKCKVGQEGKILIFVNTQDMVDFHVGLFSMVLASFGRRVKSHVEKEQKKYAHVFPGAKKTAQHDSGDEDEEIDRDDENDIHFFKLHGSMSQEERSAVFKTFQKCTAGVLLCTDVASRGLDLPHVHWIIQYNPAYAISDYVHRVGRTARANTEGSAVVFLDPSEMDYIDWAQKSGITLEERKMNKCLECLTTASLYVDKSLSVPPTFEEGATRLQLSLEQHIENDTDFQQIAMAGYRSFLRSYAAIPKDARQIFDFKKLHLGHYAKSFALRDAPNVIGMKRPREDNAEGFRQKRWKDWTEEDSYQRTMSREAIMKVHTMSEFDAGLDCDAEDKPKKTKRKPIGNKFGSKVRPAGKPLGKPHRPQMKSKPRPFNRKNSNPKETKNPNLIKIKDRRL